MDSILIYFNEKIIGKFFHKYGDWFKFYNIDTKPIHILERSNDLKISITVIFLALLLIYILCSYVNSVADSKTTVLLVNNNKLIYPKNYQFQANENNKKTIMYKKISSEQKIENALDYVLNKKIFSGLGCDELSYRVYTKEKGLVIKFNNKIYYLDPSKTKFIYSNITSNSFKYSEITKSNANILGFYANGINKKDDIITEEKNITVIIQNNRIFSIGAVKYLNRSLSEKYNDSYYFTRSDSDNGHICN